MGSERIKAGSICTTCTRRRVRRMRKRAPSPEYGGVSVWAVAHATAEICAGLKGDRYARVEETVMCWKPWLVSPISVGREDKSVPLESGICVRRTAASKEVMSPDGNYLEKQAAIMMTFKEHNRKERVARPNAGAMRL